jgi:ankyrin repeat protein
MKLDIDGLKLILLNNSESEIKEALNHFDLSSFDRNGNNVLHYFIKSDVSEKRQAEDILRFFIDAGIDINAKQTKMPKRTALHLAVMKKLKNVFDILLRNGADINAQDGNGNTALSEAIMAYRNDDGYFIETLIANGARIDLANNYGVTAKGLSDTIANYNSKIFFDK